MRALLVASILAFSGPALADPPPGRGQGQSPAKWDIQSVESDLKELDKLARKPRWQEPNFLTLYRNYLVSAKKRIESIRAKDPSWPVAGYERDLARYQQLLDQATNQRPAPPPPPAVVSAAEQAVLERVKAASAELVPGRLLVSGQGGYFDDEKKLEAFYASAERADYRQIRSEVDRDAARFPNLRTHPSVEKYLGFEEEFRRALDALILVEIGRLLDAAYANRTRNKPYGITKARAALDLIRAVRLVTDHTALTGLENQGRANMNALAQGLHPNGFHAEHAARVFLSRAPIQVRREKREDEAQRIAAGQHLYGMAYLDKKLSEIVPPNQKVLADTRLLVDGAEIGAATRMIPASVLGSDVLPIPLIPTKAEVEDDGPAVLAKILSNVMAGRHRLEVVVRLRTEAGWYRDVAKGRALLLANVAGLEAWSRLAVELQPAEAPSGGPRPPISPTGPAVITLRGQPPPPPPRVTPPPPPPPPPVAPPPPRGPDRSQLANVGLPEEKMQDAGVLKEAYAAIQQRFGKRPLKMGFASYWMKSTDDGNKHRKVTTWLVWPDEDHDGVAQVESFDLVSHWRSSRWGPLEVIGPSSAGPRHLILTSKVQ